MTPIGDHVARCRQEGFVHVVSGADGWNPYHAGNEPAESDLWMLGACDGRTFLRYYKNLPSNLASWESIMALQVVPK